MKAISTALCVILISCGFVPSLATVYPVGDAAGWKLAVDYDTWTTGKTFLLGDSLEFKYTSGHTVDEVTSSDYSTCTVGNSIKSDSSGDTKVPLSTAGTRYFICAIPTHCSGGMKLNITVSGTALATSPTSSTTPTSPGTPATTTNTPPATTKPSSATLSPFTGLIVVWAAIIVNMALN